jgi:hypothetical protein
MSIPGYLAPPAAPKSALRIPGRPCEPIHQHIDGAARSATVRRHGACTFWVRGIAAQILHAEWNFFIRTYALRSDASEAGVDT